MNTPLRILVILAAIHPVVSPARMRASPLPRDFRPGAVIVAYRDGVTTTRRHEVRAGAQAVRWERLLRRTPNLESLELPPGTSVAEVIKKLKQDPAVRFAEPDFRVQTELDANDPYFTGGSLWGMYGDASTPSNAFGSQAAEAWTAGQTGAASVFVGIIDEGIDFSHPELAPNIWTNPFEIAGNAIDDDGNGYIDDIHGWDFYFNDPTVYDGAGFETHGTHVAGTIGAVGGNGSGVAGVNWQVTMIPAKFLHNGSGYISDAIRAIDYITDLKVRHGLAIVATSNSWGVGSPSQALDEAINRAGDQGILFVAAAGNDAVDTDVRPHYPSSSVCTTRTRGEECLMSVAALSAAGSRASFSNFGRQSVDLGAPGVDIVSTQPGNGYATFSGTSMATPHVSGAIALCKAANPVLGMSDLRALVMRTTAATQSLATNTRSGGRLDVGALIAACAAPAAAVDGVPGSLAATGMTRNTIALAWTDNSRNESLFELQRSPAGCGAYTTTDRLTADTASFIVTGLASATSYCFRLRGVNASGSPSAWSNELIVSTAAAPPGFQCAVVTPEWLTPPVVQTLAMTDDSQALVNLPFSVPFYGTPVGAITVSSNGFVRMGSGVATAFTNAGLPTLDQPNAIVAPYWDDLNPGVGGSVQSGVVGTAPARRFVVSWVNVPHFAASANPISVQLVFDEATASLGMNYLDTDHGDLVFDAGASATAGVEDELGELGTQISFNQPLLVSGTSQRCSTSAPPPAPAGVTASATSSTSVGLGWLDGPNETGYVLERATATGTFSALQVLAADTITFTDTGLSAGTAYRYRIKARNAIGDSAYSPEVRVTTLAATPAPPGAPSASVSGTSVTVRWTDASNNETRFDIGRATLNTRTSTWGAISVITTAPANAVSKVVTREPRGTHRYSVRAVNAAGASAWQGPTGQITVR